MSRRSGRLAGPVLCTSWTVTRTVGSSDSGVNGSRFRHAEARSTPICVYKRHADKQHVSTVKTTDACLPCLAPKRLFGCSYVQFVRRDEMQHAMVSMHVRRT